MAHRFGEHVVAEGQQVELGEGFQVEDGAVEWPFAGRAQVIIGKTLRLDGAQVGLPLVRANEHRPADPLDARIQFGDVESSDKIAPLRPVDRSQGIHQRRPAAQGLRVLLHAAHNGGLVRLSFGAEQGLRV